ncbi:MAG: hypothetical protein M0P71_01195 [Melioribacteraceae bacterium]|nr:hypothetical protein [Melioribacteraceae bacterium]
MKREARKLAIELRRAGKSYSEIIDELAREGVNVSKGSLNNWLSKITLSDEQKALIFTKIASKKVNE